MKTKKDFLREDHLKQYREEVFDWSILGELLSGGSSEPLLINSSSFKKDQQRPPWRPQRNL